MKNFKEELPNIEAFIFDVDGVLSSHTIPLHPSGEPMRTVNIKDGYALQLAAKKGYKIAIITGGNTHSVRLRYENLGIKDIYMASSKKMADFHDFISKHNLDPQKIMYMGDDVPDLPVMKAVAMPVCPADAANDVKGVCRYVSNVPGGHGCARDVIEQVLKARGDWMGNGAFGW